MEVPKEIQNAIKNHQLVFFIGSGMSSKFGLPSWKKLVEDVIGDIDKPVYKDLLPLLNSGLMTPIEVLEKIKGEHNAIRRYISRNFNVIDGDFTVHKEIFDLSGQVITTNYDNAFERATSNKIVPSIYTSDFNISEINKNGNPYIFKLHGSFTEPDNCILFTEDYENLYSQDSSAKEKLKSIFIEKTILFVGFSFNDPDLNLIFENLDKSFGNNNKHFILTTDPKNFQKYKFLEPIEIADFREIDIFIKKCNEYRLTNTDGVQLVTKESTTRLQSENRLALLYPSPLDIDLKEDFSSLVKSFESIDATLYVGTLNNRSLMLLEDFDLIIIASKIYKSKIYIEDDNLKSGLVSLSELVYNIPNDNIPILFITNDKLEPIPSRNTAYISTFKKPIINKFIYKALRSGEFDFWENCKYP